LTTTSVTPGQVIQVRTVENVGAAPASPCVCSHVPSTPQPTNPPMSRPAVMRRPMMAPAPIISRSVWKPSVSGAHFSSTGTWSGKSGFLSVKTLAMPCTLDSSFTTAPAMAPHISASALRRASPGAACSERMVSA
jgi:hypothetical protein